MRGFCGILGAQVISKRHLESLIEPRIHACGKTSRTILMEQARQVSADRSEVSGAHQ